MQRAISADAHGEKEWHREVPGTRWFKADLHIHTVDDMPGGRAKMPDGMMECDPLSDTIPEYSRRFLQAAVDKGVQVLGITPHSPRMGDSNGDSAVWGIVDQWMNGKDDNGIPFRDSIYAVFPGFEPSFNNGKSGLHLLFLFDYNIERSTFMRAFDMVMGGTSPWPGKQGNLELSRLNAEKALERLRDFHEKEHVRNDDPCWNYLVLAPHVESKKGLFDALKAGVLGQFPHGEISGIELKHNSLPEDIRKGKEEWLQDSMAEHNQWFFHGSDAYSVSEIGSRCTWIKVASPRITALRQAFIAGQSRIEIGYERGSNGTLSEIKKTPDTLADRRPWLRSVTVSGGASFFGSNDSDRGCTRFDFSPDLTCIIGGSMTGKSTLLDGLRLYTKAQLPQDPRSQKQVEERGDLFLAGSPEVKLDCPSSDKTAPLNKQWPATFYTQSELQQLAGNSNITNILTHLVEPKKERIVKIEKKLDILDSNLTKGAKHFKEISDMLADAEQAYERSIRAAQEIEAFSSAGIEELNKASTEAHRWRDVFETVGSLEIGIVRLSEEVKETKIPDIVGDVYDDLQYMIQDQKDLCAKWNHVRDRLYSVKMEAESVKNIARRMARSAKEYEDGMRVQIDRVLADLGYDGARINQLQITNTQASLHESYRANLENVRSRLKKMEELFAERLAERKELVGEHRKVFDHVIEMIYHRFSGRIRASRRDYGDVQKMDDFVKSLGQRGITRWWNDITDGQQPTPDILLEKVNAKRLKDIGMSDAVGGSLLASLTPSRQRELAALRCKDTYQLEFKMGDGTYRQLVDLSGGQRISLLLSLLLETDDERPLIIDQPEDELDNRFLFETLLPALRRLKGRRQVILATHNANIVVNGDADQVIHLEATATHGWVAHSGTIDEPDVRNAIIRTVDGGREAFRMRKLKYGF